jgi:uncharacterized membrane protein YoaK (UPF0700 family)
MAMAIVQVAREKRRNKMMYLFRSPIMMLAMGYRQDHVSSPRTMDAVMATAVVGAVRVVTVVKQAATARAPATVVTTTMRTTTTTLTTMMMMMRRRRRRQRGRTRVAVWNEGCCRTQPVRRAASRRVCFS